MVRIRFGQVPNHRAIAVALAWVMALSIGGAVTAHDPIPGAGKGSFAANQNVTYRFTGSPPPLVITATNDSLTNYYHDSNHNSKAPTVSYSSSGTAQVVWSTNTTSPCGTSSPIWLQCAKNGGTTGWIIYIRDFANSLKPTWHWDEQTTCSGSVCWYIHRAMIHEAGHALLKLVDMDLNGYPHVDELDSVMNSGDPPKGTSGSTPWSYRRCDEAASQLVWGMKLSTGEVGDCFDHIPNHGTTGLKSKVTFAASPTYQCVGSGVTMTGIVSIGFDATNYKALSGAPLGSRVAYLQRGVVGSGTYSDVASQSTTATGGYSFIYSAVSNQSWSFRVRYAGSPGVDPTNSPAVNVTWGVC